MLTIAKTVNRRRLAKEVYDKRILHRILNVQPRPTVIEDSPEPEPIPKRTLTIHGAAHASTSVSAAWKVAGQSDDEHDAPRASTSKNAATEVIDVSSDSEEESRYEIARPPSKRQRMGTAADAHTVFTADEDEDGLVISKVPYDDLVKRLPNTAQSSEATLSAEIRKLQMQVEELVKRLEAKSGA